MARTPLLGVSLSGALGTAALAFLSACSGSSGTGSITLLFDTDADGLPDALEARLGSDARDANDPFVAGDADENTEQGPGPDSISDGLERYLLGLVMGPITARTDSDVDGLPDYIEVRIGSDPIDYRSPYIDGASDFDGPSGPAGDGISDALELYLRARGAVGAVTNETDSDGDGIEDVIEVYTGTDPVNVLDPRFGSAFDLDRDGLPDSLELRLGSNELNQHFPVFEGASDDDGGAGGPDGDGITDGLETYLIRQGAQAPVTTFSDSDGDGVPDYAEVLASSDPLDGDDPLVDGGVRVPGSARVTRALEALLVRSGAVRPVTEQSDSDGDGIVDFAEILSGTPPFDATRPAVLAHFDLDFDGVADFLEILLETDPLDANSPALNGAGDSNDASGPSGDAISDGMEAAIGLIVGAGAITTFDDTDGDGVPDFIEMQVFSSPLDPDAPLRAGAQDVMPGTGPPDDGISDALESILVALGAEAPITSASNTDSDPIPDVIELRTGSDPRDGSSPRTNASADIDGDGALDYFELLFGADPSSADDPLIAGGEDSDGDGLSDALETLLAIAGSPLPVGPGSDLDGDGLPDYLELRMPSRIELASDPAVSGADSNNVTGPPGDGISDALELFLIGGGAARPVTTLSDTDGDSIPDYLEARIGVDMFDFSDPVPTGPAADDDGDGVSNALELVLAALGALEPIDAFTDSDGDGAPDYLEVLAGGDAFDVADPASGGAGDADGDGIPDAVELLLVVLGSEPPINPRSDTDGDGVPDYFELGLGTNLALSDHPIPGGADDVADTGPPDTIPDGLEAVLIGLGARPPVSHASDSDGDGAPDYLELIAGTLAFDGADPVADDGDTDGDAMSQALERVLVLLGADEPVGISNDTDLDGAPDWFESVASAHPVEADDPVPFGATAGFDANHATGPPNDGVSDALEALLIRFGAEPPVFTSNDSDGDGLPDYFEVRIGSFPDDSSSPQIDGGDDRDDEGGPSGDGISDVLEQVLIALGATPPVTRATDSDADGAPDYLEVYRGTDPFDERSVPPPGVKPMALQVGIQGLALLGAELLGVYVYTDADNDPEGDTSFRWLRDGTPIPGALAAAYRIRTEDLGRTLAFEVTPASDFAFPSSSAVGEPVRVELFIPQPTFPKGEGGPGGIGRPDGEGDLRFWLESSSGIETSDGTRVDLWSDRSGYGVRALPIGLGNEPGFSPASGPHGMPAVRFDGSQAMSFPRPVEDDFTIIAACRTSDSTGNGSWWESPAIVGGETPPPLGDDFHLGINFGQGLFVVADVTANAGTNVSDGVPHVLTAWRVMSNGRMRLYTDGSSDGFADSSTVSLVSPENLVLGAATTTGGFWRGELYELIFFHRALNLAERRIIHNYLVGRYGGALERPLFEQYATHGSNMVGIGMNNETSFVTEAEGTGIVRIGAPTALDPGDYLLIGTDAPLDFSLSTEVPPSVTHRLRRTWSFHVTDGGGTDGVGEVDIRFRIGEDLMVSQDPLDLALLLDEDTDMTNASVVTPGVLVEDGLATFRGVQLDGFSYFGLAVRPLFSGN